MFTRTTKHFLWAPLNTLALGLWELILILTFSDEQTMYNSVKKIGIFTGYYTNVRLCDSLILAHCDCCNTEKCI